MQEIEAALTRIRRELRVAVLLVEQYLDFAWAFADRYYVMQKGRVVETGLTAETPTRTSNATWACELPRALPCTAGT